MLKAGRHRPKALLTSQSHREPTQSRTGRQIWQHIPHRELCAAVAETKEPKADLRGLQEEFDPSSPSAPGTPGSRVTTKPLKEKEEASRQRKQHLQ